jgi:hypothetical protein
MAVVRVTELPALAGDLRTDPPGRTVPYDKDGTVFGNRERLLPIKARGYYREYTVETAGSRDRGARRIVCGGPTGRRTPVITPLTTTPVFARSWSEPEHEAGPVFDYRERNGDGQTTSS